MALPIKTNNQYGWAHIEENGGKGSGNFGHSGRPGEVGGSAPSGSSSANYESKSQSESEIRERIDELTQKISYATKAKQDGEKIDEDWVSSMMEERKQLREQAKKSGEGKTKYSTESFDDAVKYIFADGNIQVSDDDMGWMGFGYDVLGKPVRYSRFDDRADDKIWQAWASMQKIQDDPMLGDVTGEGLASANDTKRLAKSVIATSQTAYLPSERKAAQEQTKKFVKGVKDEVKKAKIRLTADTKKYGDTEVRKATRKALDDISSAMDKFLGFEKPSREYPM